MSDPVCVTLPDKSPKYIFYLSLWSPCSRIYKGSCCILYQVLIPLFTFETLRVWPHSSSSSVAQLCPTLCNPKNHSMPGFPVHHQLPESTQTYVHWVGDAIQPSHPLSSPSPSALNLSQHHSLQMSQLFASGGQSIGVLASISVLLMNTQDWSFLGWTGWISLQSVQGTRKSLLQHQSSKASIGLTLKSKFHFWDSKGSLNIDSI